MSRMAERDLELEQTDDCDWAHFVASTERCPECEGSGRVVVELRWHSERVGWVDVWGWCRDCEGTGKVQETQDGNA